MNCYDMTLLGSELNLMERLFLTREKGEQAHDLLRAHLLKMPEGQPLMLVFPSDQLIDASFADESIIRIAQEIVTGEFGERCILLEGLTEDSINNITAAISLQNLKLALLATGSNGMWKCIGQLEPSLKETLEIVASRGCLTAPELSDMLRLTINGASNRLKRLYDQRLVRREYEVSEKGLQYIYHFWQWTEGCQVTQARFTDKEE